jgi:hypothetical protein
VKTLTQRGTNCTKKRFAPGIQAMRRGLRVRIAAFGTIEDQVDLEMEVKKQHRKGKEILAKE